MNQSLDIAALHRAYVDGASSPVDVIEDVYRRIDSNPDKAVWISVVPRAVAIEKARAAPRGALFGIPFAVKDNIDVAGIPTTCACPEFAYTPARSATVVEKLEAAGAILIGKTNLDQFATGLNGTRSPYGIPSNAFNGDYISGGSSSGSAVAVARGLVSFALGTDTAGSGRVPAAFNNIIGLKPTKGLISTRGVVPACRSQDVVSIFARTTADAVAVLRVAAVFDPEDDYARQAPRLIQPEAIKSGLRVGVPDARLEFFGDAEYERLYQDAIKRMGAIGATIVPFDFSAFREAAQLLYSGPWVAERLAAIGPFARQHPDALHDVVRGIVLGAEKLSAVSAFEGFYRLAALIRAAESEWQKFDVMLLPTAGTVYTKAAMLKDPVTLNSNLGAYTNFVNLMDLSALAVPAGFRSDGLPFGVTLIGRAFEDGHLATIGDALDPTLTGTKVGATSRAFSETPPLPVPPTSSKSTIQVAVVGAHLSGQPLHWQLTERNACFVKTARTDAGYSFYALANTTPAKPGLVFDGTGTGNIELEIWEMGQAEFGSFVALIPSPLGIGTVTLSDGTTVKGFLCEHHAIAGATNITHFGGWRNWLVGSHRLNLQP